MKLKLEKYLAQFVYGGIDGSVTTFAVVAGAAGAQLSSQVIIILGIANLVADGFSMGASAYLSDKSEKDMAKKNKNEHRHGISPVKIGLSTFAAFIIVGFIPLLVYIFEYLFEYNFNKSFIVASVLTGFAFIGIGWLKGVMTHTSRFRSIAETLLLGAIAAGFAYLLGDVLARALGAI